MYEPKIKLTPAQEEMAVDLNRQTYRLLQRVGRDIDGLAKAGGLPPQAVLAIVIPALIEFLGEGIGRFMTPEGDIELVKDLARAIHQARQASGRRHKVRQPG